MSEKQFKPSVNQEVEETSSTVEPKKQAPKNANDVSSDVTKQAALEHEKNLWANFFKII